VGLFLGGLLLIVGAAELFTNAVEWAGFRLGLAAGATGSLLAALGTALPETTVPVVAIIRGGADSDAIAVGAIVGAPFLLLTLGVATITLLLLLTTALDERLRRDAAGIDLVVGAKGSPLQLVLSGIYHVDVPPGNIPLAEVDTLRADPLIAEVVPIAMGDSFRGAHIVGTEPTFLGLYHARLAGGALWKAPMEAVLGADIARQSGLAIGARFAGSHGLAEGGEVHADNPYRVVGVLQSAGTVIDRLVLTGVESVWKVHEHEAQEKPESGPHAADAGQSRI